MTAATIDDVGQDSMGGPLPPRWLLVVSGFLWVLVAFVVLSLDATSVAVVGIMVGVVLLLASAMELVEMFQAPGWKWAHGALAILFLLAGIGAFMAPFQTAGILALIFGWYLLVKGCFDMAAAIAFRHVMPLWGLALAVGIGELLLGLWAIGYPGRSLALLLVWVGIGALMRGIMSIVLGFSHRHAS